MIAVYAGGDELHVRGEAVVLITVLVPLFSFSMAH